MAAGSTGSGSILVTGGSKGIGLAIARRFLSEGFATVVCARNEDALQAASADAPGLQALRCDLTVPAEVTRLARRVEALVGVPDVLVNNAGAFEPGQLHAEDESTLERMLATNLFSAYRITRALLPGMMARGSGTIINLCSTASIVAYPDGGSYSIAKHALHGFSRTLREEMKPHGIRVVSLLPGATLTASWEGVDLSPDRLMPVEDVAEMAWAAHRMSPRTVVEEILMRPFLGDIGS
ncbi:MAG TPA: SDR family oxidoreductase [Xanthomonadaceae bacterium]|nr:SDR family oxidoreductase [Xanthomonadaceae bacterium]